MKTNTKKNFLKLATMAFVLFFSVNAVNSQILTAYQDVDEIVYQTAGRDFRLYVLPDVVYSPTYDAANNENLGLNARWAWTWTLNGTEDATGKPAANQNWVEMNDPGIGTYIFTVIESNTVFSCTDAGTTKTVEVIAAPTAQITSIGVSENCGDLISQDIVVQITENVPAIWAAYSFRISRLVQNLDLNGDPAGVITDDYLVTFPLNGKLQSDNANFVYDSENSNHTFTQGTGALEVQNSLPTRYTFTLATAEDVVGNGIVSAISHKSDFGRDVTAASFGTETEVVFNVYPTPTTRPIYHIPNNHNI